MGEFSPAEYVVAGVGDARASACRATSSSIAQRPWLTADVFHAPGPPPHPFVVVVHGGSWRRGDKGELPHVSRRLAAAGYTVVDVRYALAPAEPFPRGIADVKCLLGTHPREGGASSASTPRAPPCSGARPAGRSP